MEISLKLNKTVEQNADLYFTKAKKLKKKIDGVDTAIAKANVDREKASGEKYAYLEEATQQRQKVKRKKAWYEKFRWFFSSEGFLVVGGRDATSNEIVIKKHADKDDIVLHTDMAGSPFFVIKSEGKKVGKETLQEAADATAVYSRAWGKGLVTLAVFYVTPEQVSKTANTGEFMPKGAFMIRGKTTYLKPVMDFGVGFDGEKIIAGPLSAVKKHAEKYIEVKQGSDKTSDVAKKVKHFLGEGDLDTLVRMLPSGGCTVKVKRK